MNLLKKPFSISLQALAGVLIFSCLLAHPFSEAASSPPGDKRDYMLVLNTYTESAPWSSHIINSIVAHIDQVDNFEVYTENMNSLLMTFKKHKTGEIESFKNNLLREYGKNPPRMLVLLGAPIAVLLLGEMIECTDTATLFSTPKDKRTEEYITGRFG